MVFWFWVCLAFLLTHPLRGVLALPMLSKLYVRRKDVEKLRATHGEREFQTKHELALELRRQSLLGRIGNVAGLVANTHLLALRKRLRHGHDKPRQ